MCVVRGIKDRLRTVNGRDPGPVIPLALTLPKRNFLTATIENETPRHEGSRSELFDFLNSADWAIVERSNNIAGSKTEPVRRRAEIDVEHGDTRDAAVQPMVFCKGGGQADHPCPAERTQARKLSFV